MNRVLLATLLALAGCGGDAENTADQPDQLPMVDEESPIDTPTRELPPFPAYPPTRGGHLAALGVGDATFDKTWPARALRCTAPSMLFVVAEDEESGGSVLLELPPDGPLVGEYPVMFAEAGRVPDPPAAQLGFQFFDETGASAYQAADGTVEVYGFEQRVSGRFQIEVRHIVTEERLRVSGNFHNVDIEEPPPDWCLRAGEGRDSLVGDN